MIEDLLIERREIEGLMNAGIGDRNELVRRLNQIRIGLQEREPDEDETWSMDDEGDPWIAYWEKEQRAGRPVDLSLEDRMQWPPGT